MSGVVLGVGDHGDKADAVYVVTDPQSGRECRRSRFVLGSTGNYGSL